jgi:DNA-binding MarR family transcriptional regulator
MIKKRNKMNEKRKQLATQITHLDELLLRYQMQTRITEGFTPYSGQGRVLAILKMQPEIVQKELGYLLDISKQALAELLNKLEKSGHITRTQSEKDRRSFVIKLTDTGRNAIPKENNQTDNPIEEIFDCLTQEEQTNLINYMEQIITNLEKKVHTDEDAFVEFFRTRFFEKHGYEHDTFRGFWGLHNHHHHHHRYRGFGGTRNDNDE